MTVAMAAVVVSIYFWLQLLIWCLGLWGCGWLIKVVRRRRRERGLVTPIITPGYVVKEKLHTTALNATKIGLGVVLGMGMFNLWQYQNIDVVTDAVIEGQRGTYVQYHFQHDPVPRKTYAWNFCEGRYLPHFEPHQVVKEMRFVRAVSNGHECEDLSPRSTYLRLWRENGVPILSQEE